MVERKQIALIYDYNTGWIGGTYYILNIVKALNFLPDAEKPELTIFHDIDSPLGDIRKVAYPYISFEGFHYRMSHISQIINTILLLNNSKRLIKVKLPLSKVGNFYYKSFFLDTSNINKYYCWIPDLQPMFLPQFFKKRERKHHFAVFKRMVTANEPIVFSSQAALDDFNIFFPENTNNKKILRFVSLSNTNFDGLSITGLKQKFNISGDYFIVSNQFWRHKNHMVVLEAFNEIFKRHPSLQLVFTGKEYDYRDPNYFNDVKAYVAKNNLQDNVRFLGFIDRDEQLKLMAESIAIIQPSLFEGWSTVVEDAKLLKKCVICSDIAVHREQLPGSTLFFDPHDNNELIRLIEAVLSGEITFNIDYDQERAVMSFARDFVDLF